MYGLWLSVTYHIGIPFIYRDPLFPTHILVGRNSSEGHWVNFFDTEDRVETRDSQIFRTKGLPLINVVTCVT